MVRPKATTTRANSAACKFQDRLEKGPGKGPKGAAMKLYHLVAGIKRLPWHTISIYKHKIDAEQAMKAEKSKGPSHTCHIKVTENVQKTAPVCCPVCRGVSVYFIVEWESCSLDPCDLDNKAQLMEYQCRNDECSISFWL